MISQLSEEQKNETNIKQLTGHITAIIGDAKQITYIGCATCQSKLKEKYFCERCKLQAKSEDRFYFFRAQFEDCSGGMQLAFSRQPAEEIM